MTDLFGHSIRSDLLLLCLAETCACFFVVYCLLSFGLFRGGVPTGVIASLTFAALFALFASATSGASGLYQPDDWSHIDRLLLGACIGGLLLILPAWPTMALLDVDLLAKSTGQSLIWLFLTFVCVVVSTRLGFAVAERYGLFSRRLALVLGPGEDAFRPNKGGPAFAPFEVALTTSNSDTLAPERLRAERIWGVVVGESATLSAAVRLHCQELRLRVFREAEFRERRFGYVDLNRLPEGWLAQANAAREKRLEAFIRRGFDIAVSLGLLLLSLPVLMATAVAIKLDSPGPIFYRQERVGLGGRVFTLFKFRSMVVDAEAPGVARWASQRDPRITRVGRLIRLLRIDEVPQILNVLRGEMSVVGPRPERPTFVEQLNHVIPHYQARACVRPGITGWAQVNYPYGASIDDARIKLTYDLYYIRRRSLFLDLLILIATVHVVMFQKGAR